MKTMLLFISSIFCCAGAFTQNIKIEDSKIQQENDKISITFTVLAEKIKSNERLILTPVLCSGNIVKNLNPITITGRKRSISDKRMGNELGVRTMENQRIPYSATLLYESWMSNLSLRMDRVVESCCTKRMLTSEMIAQAQHKPIRHKVVPPEIEPIRQELTPIEKLDVEALFLAPMKEYSATKNNFEVLRDGGALIVGFRQGSTVIDSSFENNASSLEQVHKVLALIEQDSNTSLSRIVLAGASSPEGSAELNDRIAKKRAESLEYYLRESLGIKASLFESINIGEDWEGLRRMVQGSDMQYKDEVLHIIDTCPVVQGREVKLMNLRRGHPYNYMLENFFPKLRNAGYIRIYYESKPSEDFIKTNEAVSLYRDKKYREALTKLEGVKVTATTEDIRGGCYLMLGENNKARKAWGEAVKLGSTQAAESLEQLRIQQAVEP